MAKYKIDWIETKSPDWKIATLTNEEGKQQENVSINKTSKKGEAFPNFDALAPGMQIEGEFWKSDSGKPYLFPPKPQTTYKSFAGKNAMTEKLMEKKAEQIGHAQENKENGIKTSSTMRMAVDIALAEVGGLADHESYERRIEYWRGYLWNAWDDTENIKPF